MALQNKLILTYPKSGAKALTNLYVEQGYHNFSSYFDTFRYSLVENDGIPYASKMTTQQQLQLRVTRHSRGTSVDDWTHLLVTKSRLKKFNKIKIEQPSIVTVNMPTFDYLPEAVSLFEGREVLCVQRSDKFTQLLERCQAILEIGEGFSKSKNIDKAFFEFCFYTLLKLERLQSYCVETGKGRIITFNNLLDGKEDLEFEYTIPEFVPSASVVTNIEELQKLFKSLTKKYNLTWEL
jgi:hypothetical protein